MNKKLYGVMLGAVVLVGGSYAALKIKTPPPQNPSSSVEVATVSDMPDPETFKTFTYDATRGKTLKVHSKGCPDKYFAVLIFSSADDYRANPAAAKVNQAFPCQKQNTKIRLIMENYNLTSGDYYYFVADQGDAGSWYNPR